MVAAAVEQGIQPTIVIPTINFDYEVNVTKWPWQGRGKQTLSELVSKENLSVLSELPPEVRVVFTSAPITGRRGGTKKDFRKYSCGKRSSGRCDLCQHGRRLGALYVREQDAKQATLGAAAG